MLQEHPFCLFNEIPASPLTEAESCFCEWIGRVYATRAPILPFQRETFVQSGTPPAGNLETNLKGCGKALAHIKTVSLISP